MKANPWRNECLWPQGKRYHGESSWRPLRRCFVPKKEAAFYKWLSYHDGPYGKCGICREVAALSDKVMDR